MKRGWVLLIIVAVFGFSGRASATLFDRGFGLIYDDQLNITWLAPTYAGLGFSDSLRDAVIAAVNDAKPSYLSDHAAGQSDHVMNEDDFPKNSNNSYFSTTWWGAMAWADQLVYENLDAWRLPTLTEAQALDANEGWEPYFPYVGTNNSYFWTSTNFSSSDASGQASSMARIYNFGLNMIFAEMKDFKNLAIAVFDGDVSVAPVPEPGTMLLLGSGLLGLAGYGRKKFFKK